MSKNTFLEYWVATDDVVMIFLNQQYLENLKS